MILDIKTYAGIGGIAFGMPRQEVRKIIGGQWQEFKKGPHATVTTDDFVGTGIHVYYHPDGTCQCLEMARPANPTLFGHELVGRPYAEVLDLAKGLDAALELTDVGFRSIKLGFSVYAPDKDDTPDALVEAVAVFPMGYWDK